MKAVAFVCAIGAMSVAASAQQVEYVGGTWGAPTNSIVLLDANFNTLGTFPAGSDLPNGIACDGKTIWSGHFTTDEVFGYDYSGNVLFSWNTKLGVGFQGLEIVGNELGAMDAFNNQISFFDPFNGSFIRSIPTAEGTTIEGLGFDGKLLWQLGDQVIWGTDPANGNVITTIPNPAVNDSFSGTGLSAVPGVVTVASAEGNWYKVDTSTGNVIQSGTAKHDFFGLGQAIPGPSALSLMGLAGLVAARRRR